MMAINRIFQTVAANESHRIKRPTVGLGAQAVNGNDSRMLETTGDLGLAHKSRATVWIVGVAVLDFLECDFAVEFAVERHGHSPQTTFGVRPQRYEATAQRRGISDRVVGVGLIRFGRIHGGQY